MDTEAYAGKNYQSSQTAEVPMGLVLEGGGLRGIFTAGVLDFLMEKDLYFPYVIGCSAGACNLLGYVAHQIGYTKNCMIQKDSDSRYYGFNQLVKEQKILDLDKVFFEYPYHQNPFDFDAFFSSPIRHEMVVTNCTYGTPEYLSEYHEPNRLSAIGKASSSLPLVTQIVKLDGKEYLDGGISDSIPIRRAVEKGCQKNVVILTRQQGHLPQTVTYQKALYDLVYWQQYPLLVGALENRRQMYQEELDFLAQEEREGRAFVIRPTIPEVKRLETNYDVLMNYYMHGYTTAQNCWDELQAFVCE